LSSPTARQDISSLNCCATLMVSPVIQNSTLFPIEIQFTSL